MKVFVKPQRKC